MSNFVNNALGCLQAVEAKIEKLYEEVVTEVKELISTEETPVQEEVTEAPVEAPSTGSKKRASK